MRQGGEPQGVQVVRQREPTPYRNDALLVDAVENLHPETRLCVATDLTLPTQEIISQTIAQWRKRKEMPNLKKRPTIFVMYAG